MRLGAQSPCQALNISSLLPDQLRSSIALCNQQLSGGSLDNARAADEIFGRWIQGVQLTSTQSELHSN